MLPPLGGNCPKKSKGPKNEATFKNRMGGSNSNCLYRPGDTEGFYKSSDNFIKKKYLNITPSVVPVTNLVCDTGASNTYIKESHKHILRELVPSKNPPRAYLPDN